MTRLNPYYPGKMAVIRKERASADRVLRILDVPPPPLDYFSGPALIWTESDEVKARTIPWWKFWR